MPIPITSQISVCRRLRMRCHLAVQMKTLTFKRIVLLLSSFCLKQEVNYRLNNWSIHLLKKFLASEKRHQLGRYYHRHSQYDQKYYCNEIIILDQAIVNLRYRSSIEWTQSETYFELNLIKVQNTFWQSNTFDLYCLNMLLSSEYIT